MMIRFDAKERSDASAVHLQDLDPDTGEVLYLTRQEFKDECDMNKIIARYTPELLIESYNAFKGTFADVSEFGDYCDMRDKVLATDSWFESLPAKIRGMFDNQVSKIVDFMDDPSNFDEAVKIGLLVRPLETQGVSSPPDVSLDVTGGSDTASVS
jgi:hypothetical protein